MGSMSLPQAFVICQVPEKNLLAWNTKGHVFKNTIIFQWWSWWYFSFAIVIFQFYIVTVSVSCALLCMFVHFIWLSLWIVQHNELVCVFTLSKAIPPEEAKETNWQEALFSKMQNKNIAGLSKFSHVNSIYCFSKIQLFVAWDGTSCAVIKVYKVLYGLTWSNPVQIEQWKKFLSILQEASIKFTDSRVDCSHGQFSLTISAKSWQLRN